MNLSRRDFFGGALATSVMFSLSGCSAFRSNARTYAANEKVRLAAIGIGCQAWYDIQVLQETGLCEIVALCDTDMGAKHTLPALKKYPSLPRYQDFRKMFDEMEDKIDAVLVGTPDHSHFAACMHAMKCGKAVYVEKPLANTFLQCELLAKAAKKYGVVTQLGNQGHSGENYWQYKAMYEKGMLRDVTKVVAHMNNQRRWHKWNGNVTGYPKKEAVPATLDWDSWLSVQPYHDYSKDFVIGEWRCWYDFGGGCMGDWGAHIIDTVHRFTLQGDLPSEINIKNVSGWNPYVFPINNTVTFKFPKTAAHGDIDLEWWEGVENQPKVPKTYLYKTNKGLFPASSANDGMIEPRLVPGKEIYTSNGVVWEGLSHSSPLMQIEGDKLDVPAFYDPKINHWKNFLLAVRGEDTANSPFSVGAPLCEIFALGCIAQRLNRSLKFDAKAKKFIGDDEANLLLSGPAPRKGWECYYKV